MRSRVTTTKITILKISYHNMSKERIDEGLSNNAQLFKALGDETRLRMVGLLMGGELCVCDIMDVLALPQSTASRHLAYLKNSGWITVKRKGRWMYYRLHESLTANTLYYSIVEYVTSFPEVQIDKKTLSKHLKQKSKTNCA